MKKRMLLKNFPIVLVSGSRQVGKSTISDIAIDKKRTKVSLDDENAMDLATTDPVAFFEQYAPICTYR